MNVRRQLLLPLLSFVCGKTASVPATKWPIVIQMPSGRGMITKYGYGYCEVFAVPMFQDNYGYILRDTVSQKCAVIDPGEPAPIISSIRDQDLDLCMALITHKHTDHAGGNSEIGDAFPMIEIVATSYEDISDTTSTVKDGDTVILGSLSIKAIHSPCHTRGHVIFYVTGTAHNDGPPLLFSGDTLFVGGCGRFFEGTPQEMLKNMDVISALPSETQVFCAHEYTESNLKFLASIDSDLCSPVLARMQKLRADGIPTVPSTVEEERSYNLFMKCRELRVQRLVGCENSPVDAIAKLRTMKNSFS